jgi:hypothetical protein
MVSFCAVCGCCTQTDIVREHLEDTRDVSAMGLLKSLRRWKFCAKTVWVHWEKSEIHTTKFAIAPQNP